MFARSFSIVLWILLTVLVFAAYGMQVLRFATPMA